MKKQERQQRFALTALFTGVVLCYFLATLLIVGITLFLLIQFSVITGRNDSPPSPTSVIVIFVLASFFVGAAITFIFSKIPLKAINQIIDQMNRLAAGDYKARIHFGQLWGKHPSMVELTDSFNRMAEELQSTEMLRSDFINNFSHEFKTPIVSITGFAKLLRRGNLSDREKEEYLAIIEEESLRLSQMATNVLNMTRVENQTILTDVSTYNLSEQIRSCILLLTAKWEKKEIELVLDFDEHDITASEELLKQVWINLIDNAVKFSPERGTVGIKIKEHGEVLSVAITNSGGELSHKQQKKIFNKFYQADESHATEGNGIGLAIVKRVTELHEGAVSVASENGQITFTVTLPAAR